VFLNRKEAGKKLAKAIKDLKLDIYPQDTVILALPRGGVVIGCEVAKVLHVQLGILVTRKIGAQFNPEYAIAAVSEHAFVAGLETEGAKEYLKAETKKERQEIVRRLKEYKINKLNLNNKTILLVDDGLATGLTMQVAIMEVKLSRPKRIIVAVPVASLSALEIIKKHVDMVVCLTATDMFLGIGDFYQDFTQVNDEEVKKMLEYFY